MSLNMGSLLPLYVPLDRISHRDTPTVKSDLIPWIHIADRQDLCAVFEKEIITTKLGHIGHQTIVKIKAGVKIVETLVLEDLVCQAAVQEGRLSSSPSSPAHFAIFTNCPDIAFRYRLPNGQFRKIQVLFRYKDGFESAVKVLEWFNLPLVHKEASSQRQSSKARDAPSTSTRLSMGPPTIFSHISQSTGTKTIPPSQQASTGTQPLTYGHHETSVSRISTSHQSQASRYPGRIIRPGPSLIEPIIETNDEPYLDRWRSQSVFDLYDNGNISPQNYGHNVGARRDVLEGRLHASTIRQSHEPGQRNRSISHIRCVDTPLSRLQSSYFSRDNDLQEDLPASNRYRLFNNRDMFDTLNNKNKNELVAKEIPELIPETNVVSQAASSTLASAEKSAKVKEGKENERNDIAQVKAAPKKRQPKRVFKATASQTELSSISKSTQTQKLNAYISGSTQTRSATFPITNQDQATQTEACMQNSTTEMITNINRAPDFTEDLINNLVTSPPLKKCRLPVNKFGKGRRRVPILAPEMQNMERLGIADSNSIYAKILLPRKCVRGINKFGRTQRKVC